MRWLKKLFVLLLFGVNVLPVHAQAYIPPVLRPEDIFTKAVQVVQTFPILNADNDTHTFYFLNSAKWDEYVFPSGLAEVNDILRRNDGTYLISDTYYTWIQHHESNTDDLWIFNPSTGKITRPERECNMLKDLPGEGQWVFFQPTVNAPYYLCFSENGTLSDPLPKTINLCGNIVNTLDNRPLYLSPDRKWVLFSDCEFPGFSLYSYNISTRQLNFLGKNPFGEDERVELKRWADNTHPVLYSTMSLKESVRSIFLADVTKTQSLRPLLSQDMGGGYQPVLEYMDNPPRYWWIPGFANGYSPLESDENSCLLHELNFKTLKVGVYPYIPGVCDLGILIPDGTGDRLETEHLMRFNFGTRRWQWLLNDEVAFIDSISPRGRFAAVVLGKPPYVELDAGADPKYVYATPDFAKSSQLVVVNLKNGTVVYRTALTLGSVPDWGQEIMPQLMWLDDADFSLVTTEASHGDPIDVIVSKTAQVVHIDPRQSGLPVASKNLNPRVIVDTQTQDQRYNLGLYDPTLQRVIPVICGLDAGKYRVESHLDSDGLLEISIVDLSKQYYPPFVLRHWRVRVMSDTADCP